LTVQIEGALKPSRKLENYNFDAIIAVEIVLTDERRAHD